MKDKQESYSFSINRGLLIEGESVVKLLAKMKLD